MEIKFYFVNSTVSIFRRFYATVVWARTDLVQVDIWSP